jgi:hypothetical protein
MNAEDILFYENEMVDIVKEFVEAIAKPSKAGVNNGMWDFYLDFTQEKFIDEIEEEEERNPERLA